MAAADLYRARVQNTTQGPGNIAIVDFSVDPAGPTIAITAASIAAYLGALGVAGVFGASTSLVGIDYLAAGAAGALPVAWPTAQYNAIQTANVGLIPAWTGYGTATGSGTLEAVGTSLTVSLYSATPGRHTTGRHYLPYVGTAINDGNGRVVSTGPTQVEQAYSAFIQGVSAGTYTGVDDIVPVVYSKALNSFVAVVNPKVSINFARLKTRTR